MNCPECKSKISKEEINVQTDLVHCQNCGNIFSLSGQVLNGISSIYDNKFDLSKPPKGAWVEDNGQQVVIGATTRSPMAFFLVPFMLVWSGGSIGGIYGTQILSGKFDLFSSLFGIPFLLGSVLFWSIALMSIWGKVEITLDKLGGTVFTGIGMIGRRKKFLWKDVATISEKASLWKKSGSKNTSIHMEGTSRISFAGGVNSSRMYFLLNALKYYHRKINNED